MANSFDEYERELREDEQAWDQLEEECLDEEEKLMREDRVARRNIIEKRFDRKTLINLLYLSFRDIEDFEAIGEKTWAVCPSCSRCMPFAPEAHRLNNDPDHNRICLHCGEKFYENSAVVAQDRQSYDEMMMEEAGEFAAEFAADSYEQVYEEWLKKNK